MSIPTLPGITAKTITTDRITTRVLFSGPDSGAPILFLHGNVSSATWWEETMLALPDGFRGIAPDQRGFGEAEFEKKIDATRGMGDLADDAIALLDHLDIDSCHVVGNSLGGNVVWQLLGEHGQRFLTATQAAPGSPYGFGSTKGMEGTATWSDFAGSGGGLSNPELLKRLAEGDRSLDSQFSPLAALRSVLVKPPFIASREEDLLSAMLAVHLGVQDNPGGFEPTPNWPHVAPGKWGAANALSPKYLGGVVEKLLRAESKVSVLWVRGDSDLAVSNTALSDPGFLGMQGLLPGWPGAEIYPPQPMIDQTRAVLDRYAVAGGSYNEVVLEDTGHIPFIEKPDEFNHPFHQHLQR